MFKAIIVLSGQQENTQALTELAVTGQSSPPLPAHWYDGIVLGVKGNLNHKPGMAVVHDGSSGDKCMGQWLFILLQL